VLNLHKQRKLLNGRVVNLKKGRNLCWEDQVKDEAGGKSSGVVLGPTSANATSPALHIRLRSSSMTALRTVSRQWKSSIHDSLNDTARYHLCPQLALAVCPW